MIKATKRWIWYSCLWISLAGFGSLNVAWAQSVNAQENSGVSNASVSATVSAVDTGRLQNAGVEETPGEDSETSSRKSGSPGHVHRKLFSGSAASFAGANDGFHPSSSFHSRIMPRSFKVMSPGRPVVPQSETMPGSAPVSLPGKYPAAVGSVVKGEFPDSTMQSVNPSPPFHSMPTSLLFHPGHLMWSPDFGSVTHLKLSYTVSVGRVEFHYLLRSWIRRDMRTHSDVQLLRMGAESSSDLRTMLPKDPLLDNTGNLNALNQIK